MRIVITGKMVSIRRIGHLNIFVYKTIVISGMGGGDIIHISHFLRHFLFRHNNDKQTRMV